MQDHNSPCEVEKKKKTNSIIPEISTLVLSLLPKEDKANLDSLEITLTPIFSSIRKQTTERYFLQQDTDEHYCENCGQKMQNKESLKRKIVGLAPYDIKRRSFYCDRCKRYERPLDNKLNLAGRFSLEIRKAMLLLGQRIPFQEASEYLDRLLGVQVSDQSILSLVESVGRKVHEEDLSMVRKLVGKEGFVKHESVDKPKKAGTAYLQMDGMMVQTREERWKEIRNGILFSGDHQVEMDQQPSYRRNL